MLFVEPLITVTVSKGFTGHIMGQVIMMTPPTNLVCANYLKEGNGNNGII